MDMFIHFKAFPIKLRFFNKQVGDGELDIVVHDLFPPRAGDLVVFSSDECL